MVMSLCPRSSDIACPVVIAAGLAERLLALRLTDDCASVPARVAAGVIFRPECPRCWSSGDWSNAFLQNSLCRRYNQS